MKTFWKIACFVKRMDDEKVLRTKKLSIDKRKFAGDIKSYCQLGIVSFFVKSVKMKALMVGEIFL